MPKFPTLEERWAEEAEGPPILQVQDDDPFLEDEDIDDTEEDDSIKEDDDEG